MNIYDIAVLVIVGFCLIRGIFRGLIKEVASMVGVLAGFFGAYTYYADLARLLSRWFDASPYLQLLSFLALFCIILLLVSVLGVVIKYLMRVAFLGWVDRLCGAGFGLVKGLLIAAVLLMPLTAFLPRDATLIRNSMLAPHVNAMTEPLSKLSSKSLKRQFRTRLAELKKVWQQPQR